MNFMQALRDRWDGANTLVCVGLDPEPAKFPQHLRDHPDAVFEFNRAIIDATAAMACCFSCSSTCCTTSSSVCTRENGNTVSPLPLRGGHHQSAPPPRRRQRTHHYDPGF